MHNPHISIPLGICIGLLASFVQSLGLTVQRKSHILNKSLPEYQQRVEHRRPLWLLGFAIFISSNIIGSLVQIASLPIVILAPLGAVSLLWNALFARVILGDVFSPWTILGTILIAGGAVLIALFGVVPEPTHSLEDLLILFSRPTFIIYFSIFCTVVFLCLSITHIMEYSISRESSKDMNEIHSPAPEIDQRSNHPLTSTAALMTTGLGVTKANTGTPTEYTPLLDPKPLLFSPVPSYQLQTLLSISYASSSGIISGMCLIFAKGGVELLVLTWRGQNQFWRWEAWILVLGLCIFALLQLWYLHKALVLADPTLVCPSAFCFYNLSSIVSGLVYFDLFPLIPPVHLAIVGLGISVLLGGVWVVSIQSESKEVDVGAWSESEDGDGYIIRRRDATETHEGHIGEPEHDRYGGQGSTSLASAEPENWYQSVVGNSVGRRTDHGAEDDLPTSHLQQSTGERSQIRINPLSRSDLLHWRGTTQDSIQHVSSSQHGHPHVGYGQPSPPVLPINASAGFQIGLSAVSPGFVIVPRGRGRRSSGLGLADVVIDARQQEQWKRRIVSEADIGRTLDGTRSDETGCDMTDHGKGKGKEGEERWKWLRKIFR